MSKENHHETKHENKKDSSSTDHTAKSFYQKGYFPVLLLVIFSIIFSAVFNIYLERGHVRYERNNDLSPSIKEFTSQNTKDEIWGYVKQFGILAGIAVGILAMIGLYILYGIAAVTKLNKIPWVTPTLATTVSTAVLTLGIQLTFIEPRTSALGNAIIFGLGVPLYITSIIMTIIYIAILALSIVPLFNKNTATKSLRNN